METYRYDAFISYRHVPHDQAVAKRLHTLLETYRIPGPIAKTIEKKKLTRIFRDEEELPIAASLNDSLTEALRQSEWLIVIASPDWRASNWCNAEVDEFIRLGRRDHILIVLAKGTPETSFPLQLMTVETEEGVKATEPLAANILAPTARESVKKLDVEKLRILAPMLGVNFDDLKRRALQRKIKTAVIVAAAVLAAGAGLLTYILIENQKQAELRLQAEQERAEKEKERILKGMASIGELLEKAKSATEKDNNLSAMESCLEALEISDTIEGAEHEKIIEALRKASYAEPFSKIADFDNQNVRMTDMVAGPDGRTMAGIVNSNSIALVDVIEGTVKTTISTGQESIMDIRFSPDGSKVAALCEKGKVAVCWNTADGSEYVRYVSKQNQEYQIANLAFLENDVLLIQDMAELYRITADAEPLLIYTIGQYNGSYNRNYNFFTRSFGQIDDVATFLTDDYTGVSLAVSEDRQSIAISDSQGQACVTVIDPMGKLILALTDMPGLFSERYYLSPNGKYLACTSYLGYFAAWNVETKTFLYAYAIGDRKSCPQSNIVFSADGETMAFVWGDLLVMNTKDAAVKYYLEYEDTNYVPELSLTPDGKYYIYECQSIEILRAEDGSMVTRMPADAASNYTAAHVTSDMARLLTARSDGTAEVFCTPGNATVTDAETFTEPYLALDSRNNLFPAFNVTGVHELSQGFKDSTAVTDFTPIICSSADGAWTVICYADGAMEIFQKDKGETPVYTLWEFQIKANCVRFFENTLFAADMNGQVLTFDLAEMKILTKFKANYAAQDIAVSPDGKRMLLLSNFTNTAYVYPTDGTEQLFYLRTHTLVQDGGFTEDGMKVVVQDVGGTYVVGDLLTDEAALVNRARELTGREAEDPLYVIVD